MISLFKYLSSRRRLISTTNIIKEMGGDDPFLMAQQEMYEKETIYFYYRFISEIIYFLIFILVCYTLYEGLDGESYMRVLWDRMFSWYVQTMAWGKLQI